jgi:hypothetical protein
MLLGAELTSVDGFAGVERFVLNSHGLIGSRQAILGFFFAGQLPKGLG